MGFPFGNKLLPHRSDTRDTRDTPMPRGCLDFTDLTIKPAGFSPVVWDLSMNQKWWSTPDLPFDKNLTIKNSVFLRKSGFGWPQMCGYLKIGILVRQCQAHFADQSWDFGHPSWDDRLDGASTRLQVIFFWTSLTWEILVLYKGYSDLSSQFWVDYLGTATEELPHRRRRPVHMLRSSAGHDFCRLFSASYQETNSQ